MRCNIFYTEFLDARKLLFSLKEKMSRRCHNREKANPQKTKLGGKGEKEIQVFITLKSFQWEILPNNRKICQGHNAFCTSSSSVAYFTHPTTRCKY